ncbi:hypothetical protein D9M71_540190 [compost metagenome]
MQRQRHAQGLQQGLALGAGRHYQAVAGDLPASRGECLDGAATALNRQHLRIAQDVGAVGLGAFQQQAGHCYRVNGAFLRGEKRLLRRRFEIRLKLLNASGSDPLDTGNRCWRLAERQRADPVDRHRAQLALQAVILGNRQAAQFGKFAGLRCCGVDPAKGSGSHPQAWLALVDHRDLPVLAQVIGNRGTDDAGADHHHARALNACCHWRFSGQVAVGK